MYEYNLVSEITGGIGLSPSGNIGDKVAVFEPVHGTAPGRAGKGIANPIATLLAAKLMLVYLGQEEAGRRIQIAVEHVISKGEVLTPDMGGKSTTDQLGDAVMREIQNLSPNDSRSGWDEKVSVLALPKAQGLLSFDHLRD